MIFSSKKSKFVTTKEWLKIEKFIKKNLAYLINRAYKEQIKNRFVEFFHYNVNKEKEEAFNKLKTYEQEGRISQEEKVKLEQKIEELIHNEIRNETVWEVLKNPFKKYFRNIFMDLNYEELFKGDNKRKSRLNDLAIFLSFGYTSVPHELLHAGTNKALGGVNEEIVINKFFDLGLSQYLIPGVESKFLLPIMGGYVKPDMTKINNLEHALVTFAPYILTPLGIYLVQKGKEKKCLPLAIAGSGAILSQAGGILGDFLSLGSNAVNTGTEFIYTTLGGQNYQEFANAMWLPMLVGGFFVWLKTATFSYRLFKAGINQLRNTFS